MDGAVLCDKKIADFLGWDSDHLGVIIRTAFSSAAFDRILAPRPGAGPASVEVLVKGGNDLVNEEGSKAKGKALIRVVVRCLGVLAVLWVFGCGALYSFMRKPPEEFGRFMSKVPAPVVFLAFPFETLWKHARAGTLRVGDAAPDFELLKVDKSERIHFSTLHQQQPVVLVFGSYT